MQIAGTILLLLTGVSTQAPQEPDRIVDVQVTDIARIGGANAPEWATLEDVRQIAFTPAAELWIADGRSARYLVVDGAGRFVRSVGRAGKGPGEFSLAGSVAVSAEGRVITHDALDRRFQLFTPEGTLQSSHRAPPALGSPSGMYWISESVAIGHPRLMKIDSKWVLSSDYERPADGIPVYRLEFASAGEPQVSLLTRARFRAPPSSPEPFTPHAFGAELHMAGSGGRVALNDSPEYDIRVLDAAGRQMLRLTRPHAPRRPSRADLAAARSEARARLISPDGSPRIGRVGTGGAAPATDLRKRIDAALDGMTHEDRIPVIRNLAFDRAGRLWVQRTGAVWGTPGPVDLFDVNGRYIGSTARLSRLPDAFGPDGLIAFIEKDDLDVPWIRLQRVTIR